MARTPTIEMIREDFALLESWEDRYTYVIELGRALPAMPPAQRTEVNKVRGCASQVWLSSEVGHDATGAPILHFEGDSDAILVRGLVALLIILVQDRDAASVMALDINTTFTGLGLGEHLTPQRSNGLASMAARVRADAAKALASGS
jgi:cysteine desulfuration protein SufE